MTCSTCKHWSPDTISKVVRAPTVKERLCRRSLDMSFPACGKDGSALMTFEDFGCILHERAIDNSQIPDK